MTRYFVSAESLEANRSQVLADEAAHIEAKRLQRIVTNRDHNRARYAKKKAERAHLPKPPRKTRMDAGKSKKPPKLPKPIVFAKSIKAAPKPSFKDLPEIIPPHVKVQKLPGYTGAPAWELRGKTW